MQQVTCLPAADGEPVSAGAVNIVCAVRCCQAHPQAIMTLTESQGRLLWLCWFQATSSLLVRAHSSGPLRVLCSSSGELSDQLLQSIDTLYAMA